MSIPDGATTLVQDAATGARLIFVPRSTWGSRPSTEAFIDARRVRAKTSKTEIHIHHTAAAGGDDTPNQWSYDEAVHYMRRLETNRPDLGPLPYSENPALDEDGRTVWLFEGRGLQVTGAHTGGHNIPGIGFGWLGNFTRDAGQDMLANIGLPMLSRRLGFLRHADGFTRIGNTRSPRGWEVWGHRDTKATACPGGNVYWRLADVHYIAGAYPPIGPPTDPPEDPMTQTLARGSEGELVERLQTALHKLGFGDVVGTIDGDYGPKTEAGVAAWQTAVHLEPTGVTDGLTYAALIDDAFGGGHTHDDLYVPIGADVTIRPSPTDTGGTP